MRMRWLLFIASYGFAVVGVASRCVGADNAPTTADTVRGTCSGFWATLTAPQFLGPVSAATIATLGVLATLRGNRSREFQRLALEIKIRRLTELYTPLQLLLRHSEQLYKKLRVGTPPDWRAVPNIKEILSDPRKTELLKRIVEIGKRIEAIVLEKAGLVHAETLPESFHQYVRHIGFLDAAIADPESRVESDSGDLYPRDLNDHVDKAAKQLRAAIQEHIRKFGEP